MFGDRIFYPLAAMVIIAMVGLALSFAGNTPLSDQDIVNEGLSLTGPDLLALTISPGSNGTYVEEGGGYMRLSQFTPKGEGPASIGVFLTLGPDYERAFSGRRLRVTLRARAPRIDALEQFESAYYPMESRRSDWFQFNLGPDWQDYTFDFMPPITDNPPNVDLLAIFPGVAGESRQMDLAALNIEVLVPET
ncbi:hypothetical protein ACFFUB_07025 [Algimonas porphyrae]|uniref:NADH:ubiquinone oxidoreductase intermediate-associated protein 30 domain-containing protein n=1 Tax=Algimonas porphyrae TaxID=1128113 RepID=A0ABQ5V2K6_9PROT|nr:hypothetical protein [Algimonas porphyrae]GLQ21083.1 hypothetical protein GCM10007854_20380 [Algimonas porphyrae]